MAAVKKKTPAVARLREKGSMDRWSTEDFKGHCETVLYDSVVTNTCHQTFVQIHRMYTINSES